MAPEIFPSRSRISAWRASLSAVFSSRVVHPGDVLLGFGQLPVRLFLAGAELDDAGGLLEDLAAVLPLAGQDLVDPALADDGIAFLADTGIAEQVDDVLQAAGGPVQEIFALPAAVDPAGDQDLGILQGEALVFIVKDQGNFAVAQGLPPLGAAEDHVLHAGAAQGPGVLLSEHPAHRVRDIAFSGSVRSHDGGDAFLEDDLSPLRKGLEPVQFQLL